MDEKTAIKLFALFLVSFISVNLNLSTISAASALNPEENSTITALLNELNASNIMRDIGIFASFGSRVTGYPGCDEAAQYIVDEFRSFGLSVEIHVKR